MGGIVLTYGFIALNNPLTEDTDKPTNPWLELILESNKNEKEPTKLWNFAQKIIKSPKPGTIAGLTLEQIRVAENIVNRLRNLEMDYEIDFSQDTFKEVNFKSAIFCLPTSFENAKFLHLQILIMQNLKVRLTLDPSNLIKMFTLNMRILAIMRISQMLNLEQKETKLKSTILCFQPLNSTTLQLLIIANFMVKAVSMERCLTE